MGSIYPLSEKDSSCSCEEVISWQPPFIHSYGALSCFLNVAPAMSKVVAQGPGISPQSGIVLMGSHLQRSPLWAKRDRTNLLHRLAPSSAQACSFPFLSQGSSSINLVVLNSSQLLLPRRSKRHRQSQDLKPRQCRWAMYPHTLSPLSSLQLPHRADIFGFWVWCVCGKYMQHKICHFNHFEVCNSVAFIIFTLLHNHPHVLFPKPFFIPNRNSIPIKQ